MFFIELLDIRDTYLLSRTYKKCGTRSKLRSIPVCEAPNAKTIPKYNERNNVILIDNHTN